MQKGDDWLRKMLAVILILVAAVSTGHRARAAESESILCPTVEDWAINRAASAEGDYIALGDSIAAGWGTDDHYGYAERFRDLLQDHGEDFTLNNTARAGLTSCGLLTQVITDSTTRDALAGARVVSISIGGNDLLACARDNYKAIDEICAVRALTRFQYTWSEILEQLPISSDVRLLVMTIYSPYPPDSAVSTEAEAYIGRMNAIIRGSSDKPFTVQVVDAHDHFQGWTDAGDWKGCAWTHFCDEYPDIHPNGLGYAEIADLHWLAYADLAQSQTPDEEEPDYWWWGAQTPW